MNAGELYDWLGQNTYRDQEINLRVTNLEGVTTIVPLSAVTSSTLNPVTLEGTST